MYNALFSPLTVDGRTLENRIVMAPLYLGYAAEGGWISPMLLEHYRLMAKGGAAMIVVENATVAHPAGSGSTRTIRLDTDENLQGLEELAREIKSQGALACIQINHAGRFAGAREPLAPSAVETFGRTPKALGPDEIADIREKFCTAAKRVVNAGFDMVELHGGTGYLLASFVSPRTNRRTDAYGETLENRMKFPLEVFSAVKSAVGDFPVGYRFLADEWMDDGLKPDESALFAGRLSDAGAAYLSVMGGTYESFQKPEIIARSKSEAYMADLSEKIKAHANVPVITAGRISSPQTAENLIASGQADLVGLARVLWADPEWPEKARQGLENEIIHCDPDCEDVCMQRVMKGKPAYCTQWPPEKIKKFKELYQ